MTRWLRLVAVVGIGVCLAGCPTDGPKPCVDNAGCPDGQVCSSSGICVLDPRADSGTDGGMSLDAGGGDGGPVDPGTDAGVDDAGADAGVGDAGADVDGGLDGGLPDAGALNHWDQMNWETGTWQ
ncbi:MAG: hypothetical protein AB1555_20140 [Nitrospirota bacterium]